MKYNECKNYFPIPEAHPDYEPGKGDWVIEHFDEVKKIRYWTSKIVTGDTEVEEKDLADAIAK